MSQSPANEERPLIYDQGRMRSLVDLLMIEKMEGVDDRTMMRQEGGNNMSRWKIIRERLGLNHGNGNGISCCGIAGWRYENSSMENSVEESAGTTREVEVQVGTNLGAALEVERQFRFRATENRNSGTRVSPPLRVSLMRLLEETETETETGGGDGIRSKEDEGSSDSVCCVCMERKKGGALIPCGHTYCRLCCRDLCINRGSCPLCNRRILDILHIF